RADRLRLAGVDDPHGEGTAACRRGEDTGDDLLELRVGGRRDEVEPGGPRAVDRGLDEGDHRVATGDGHLEGGARLVRCEGVTEQDGARAGWDGHALTVRWGGPALGPIDGDGGGDRVAAGIGEDEPLGTTGAAAAADEPGGGRRLTA